MIDKILEIAYAVNQSRSRFQIEKFVIGQHDTPEMQFFQLCLELQTAIATSKRMELEIKKGNLTIQRLKDTGDELDSIDAQMAEIGLNQSISALRSLNNELEILIDIWNTFETKFSRDQIESNQEEYWTKRLVRQATAQVVGSGSVDMGHIEALSQAGALEDFIAMHNGQAIEGKNDIHNLE